MLSSKTINQVKFERPGFEIEESAKKQTWASHRFPAYQNATSTMTWASFVQPPAGTCQLLTPGMYAMPQMAVSSATPEILDNGYVFNDRPLDLETTKNALLAGTADFLLATRSEYQPERARYYPTHSDVIIAEANGCPALRFDDLFDLPVNIGKFIGNPEYPVIALLAHLTTPYLRLASSYDLGNELWNDIAMLGKARNILMTNGINASNPYTINVDAMTILEGRYRIGQFALRSFAGERIIYDSAGQPYTCRQVLDKVAYIPLRSITRAKSDYIRPTTLPHSDYYLTGIEKLERTNVKTIVLTPDPWEVVLNASNTSIAVVSWIGWLYTIDAVKNWSLLQGRNICYAWNTATFDGDEKLCAKTFYGLYPLLEKMECTVNLLVSSAKSRFQGQVFTNSTFGFPEQSPANDFRALVYSHQNTPNTNIYKEVL